VTSAFALVVAVPLVAVGIGPAKESPVDIIVQTGPSLVRVGRRHHAVVGRGYRQGAVLPLLARCRKRLARGHAGGALRRLGRRVPPGRPAQAGHAHLRRRQSRSPPPAPPRPAGTGVEGKVNEDGTGLADRANALAALYDRHRLQPNLPHQHQVHPRGRYGPGRQASGRLTMHGHCTAIVFLGSLHPSVPMATRRGESVCATCVGPTRRRRD